MLNLKSFKRIVLDIETNGLLQHMLDFSTLPLKLSETANLWMVVLTNADNINENVALTLEDCTKENMQICFKNCEEVIAHNGVKFDFFALKLFDIFDYKVYYYETKDGNNGEVFGKPLKITDTLILSKILEPDRFGGHSLDSWGRRVGVHKTDYRQVCIEKGYIEDKSPAGFEFSQYFPPMLEYCIDDTKATAATLKQLEEDKRSLDLSLCYQMELKLADLTVKQEFYGFAFDKELAVKNLNFLNKELEDKRNIVNPILPPKKLNKTEAKKYLPPKTQFKKDGTLSTILLKFIEKLDAILDEENNTITYNGKDYTLPLDLDVCLKETMEADIEDLNHLKHFLITQGWFPSEWVERDLTKPAGKKTRLSDEKIKETIDRYVESTLTGLFKEERLRILETTEDDLSSFLHSKINEFAIRVPTSPAIKVGTNKKMCPNLEELGAKAEFVKHVIEFLTYRHRRNSIAGGVVDEETDEHSSGFLTMVEKNGRIRTPADTLGSVSGRYRHIGVDL